VTLRCVTTARDDAKSKRARAQSRRNFCFSLPWSQASPGLAADDYGA